MTKVGHGSMFRHVPIPLDLIFTVEAAEILKVDARSVARMAQDGRLTPAAPKLGRTSALVFHRAEVIELARQRAQASQVAS